MIRFEDILDKVESYKPDFDEELLQKAYIFSAREHRGQVRSSGEPYLVHPLNVAHILADLHLDETSIAVGLLHDVLEDTLTTKEKLQEVFGEDVAELVDAAGLVERIKSTLPPKLRDNEISGDVNGRVKSMYSIWSKLQKQEIDIGQLYDYIGFRIITGTLKIVTPPWASSIRCGGRFL